MVVSDEYRRNRRALIAAAAAGGAFVLVSRSGSAAHAKAKAAAEDWVSPPEDLMREHGVLERLLLIYDACATAVTAGDAPPAALPKAAQLVRRFIEDYHERLEEEHLFPRFEKAGQQVELVRVLRQQHQQGRRLTDDVERLAAGSSASDRKGLVAAIAAFSRMYRPHAAREDTVLFPAFRSVVGAKEFRELGERFEDQEHELFGKAGFEGIVDEVAALERTLGIEDLKQFTPT